MARKNENKNVIRHIVKYCIY